MQRNSSVEDFLSLVTSGDIPPVPPESLSSAIFPTPPAQAQGAPPPGNNANPNPNPNAVANPAQPGRGVPTMGYAQYTPPAVIFSGEDK
jgi:hypothetical protein